ncbi:MAG: HPr(Ser) kinase/phosphatase [Clostridia bacterium]|nr:HPr(Ser) kinase/phosphatase [Clostridia bacterium]
MNETYCTLGEVIDEFSLTPVYLPENGREIRITRPEVNRPGLQLAGFFENFEGERIQLLGKLERSYVESFQEKERLELLDKYLSHKPVCLVFSHTDSAIEGSVQIAEKYGVPLLYTEEKTTALMANLISSLNVKLAPMISRHGVFVEVYGEGILIVGDSGIGKSEAAIELVKRGHRLVADDAVEIRKVSEKTLVGSSPELIRHYIELRGIGIVDVRRIFGMGAVKNTEKISLVINLEQWDKEKFYDRFGLETEYADIMGIKIPSITVPVKPGRNLAVIIEIAAMNHRQKKMGYDTAVEFNKKLMGLTLPDESDR